MTLEGWVFIVVSWTAILALCAFCLARMFRKKS
jgi:hypothetical protein